MLTLFWISAALLFYTYIGHGLLLLLLNAVFKRRLLVDESLLPPVTFIVPAYNEEDVIRQKIENTLALDYPADKLSFLFVTDGSTDDTAPVIGTYPQLALLHHAHREGKSAAINRAMKTVQTPLVVFSDANTMVHPQSLRKMVRHYADGSVGGVSGEKRIAPQTGSAVNSGERLYWQYESLLKRAAGDFYTIVGAAGELFSIRTKLFRPLNNNVILDDFVLSAAVCLQGYRFLYEPQAFGLETASATISDERKRKIRISAGCYQALAASPSLLNVFKNFRLAFQYISHRVLRWVFCPLALPALLISNLFLYAETGNGFYAASFGGQCAFYFLGLAGWWLPVKKPVVKAALLPFYFLFMVSSQYAGLYRFLTRSQPAVWEKVRRRSAGTRGA